MINAATFIGEPSNFQNICKIYPPTVRDIVANPIFSPYLRLFTLTLEDIQDEIKQRGLVIATEEQPQTELEFILNSSKANQEFKALALEAFRFFLHEEVEFLFEQKAILVGGTDGLATLTNLKNLRLLTENNFFDFQNAIRRSVGIQEIKPTPPPDPNEDPRIRKMKEKIRERDRIKAKQQAQGKGKDGISLQTTLAAICCMGIGLTPLNIGELSYASLGCIMTMMQEKEKYDMDIKSLLAGASSKKIKPKYWIRNSD